MCITNEEKVRFNNYLTELNGELIGLGNDPDFLNFIESADPEDEDNFDWESYSEWASHIIEPVILDKYENDLDSPLFKEYFKHIENGSLKKYLYKLGVLDEVDNSVIKLIEIIDNLGY